MYCDPECRLRKQPWRRHLSHWNRRRKEEMVDADEDQVLNSVAGIEGILLLFFSLRSSSKICC